MASTDLHTRFVSEGTAQQKLASIRRSHYLSFVYDHILPDLGPNLVVYGFAFAENDTHILEALATARLKRMAVSVFTGTADNQVDAYCLEVEATLAEHLPNVDVTFVDSSSPGFWLNNPAT